MNDGTIAENTQMYINVLNNPYIQIIGHPVRAGLPFDMDELCKAAKATGKMLEINEHSFDSGEKVIAGMRELLECCAKYGTKISVGSDAHSAWFVGKFDRAKALLEEVHFPEELIASRDLKSFRETIEAAKKADM